MSDDMRKLLDIVEECDRVDEGFFSDMFGSAKKSIGKARDKRKSKKSAQSRADQRRNFGEQRTQLIDLLADKIEEYGLTDQAIEYIDQNDRAFAKESLEERVIDDRGIKQVLVQIAKTEAGLGDKPAGAADQEAAAKAEQYFIKWKTALEKAYGNMRDLDRGTEFKAGGQIYKWAGAQWQKQTPNGKWQPVSAKQGDPSNMELTDEYMKRTGQTFDVDGLTKEMIGYLADRKGQPVWKDLSRKVKQEISKYANREEAANVIDHIDQGEMLEGMFYHAFTALLRECESTWFNLGWKPTGLHEGFVSLSPCVPNRDILIENFLTDVVMYDKIAQLKNKHKG